MLNVTTVQSSEDHNRNSLAGGALPQLQKWSFEEDVAGSERDDPDTYRYVRDDWPSVTSEIMFWLLVQFERMNLENIP